jgi:hypothetical protein
MSEVETTRTASKIEHSDVQAIERHVNLCSRQRTAFHFLSSQMNWITHGTAESRDRHGVLGLVRARRGSH